MTSFTQHKSTDIHLCKFNLSRNVNR